MGLKMSLPPTQSPLLDTKSGETTPSVSIPIIRFKIILPVTYTSIPVTVF